MLMDVVAVYRVIGDTRLSLRKARGNDAECIAWLPHAALVDALEEPADGWVRVRYDGQIGYCMTDYLSNIEDEPEEAPDESGAEGSPPEMVSVRRDVLETIRTSIDSILAGRYTPPP